MGREWLVASWSPMAWATSVQGWKNNSTFPDSCAVLGRVVSGLALAPVRLWDGAISGILAVWSGDVPPRWPLASSSQGYSLSPVGLTGSQRPAEQQADPRCQTQLQIQYREMERPAPQTGHKRDCQSAVTHLVCHIPVGLLCHWPSSPQHQVCAHYGWGN